MWSIRRLFVCLYCLFSGCLVPIVNIFGKRATETRGDISRYLAGPTLSSLLAINKHTELLAVIRLTNSESSLLKLLWILIDNHNRKYKTTISCQSNNMMMSEHISRLSVCNYQFCLLVYCQLEAFRYHTDRALCLCSPNHNSQTSARNAFERQFVLRENESAWLACCFARAQKSRECRYVMAHDSAPNSSRKG